MSPTHDRIRIAEIEEPTSSWHHDTVESGDGQVVIVADGRKKVTSDRMLALNDPE
jgi:hypothetical protein